MSPTLDYVTPNERTGRRNGGLICIGILTAVLPSTCLYQSLNIFFFVPLLVGIACAIVGCFRMDAYAKARARVTTIGLVLCVAASLGPFIYFAWLNREGKPISIILPVGYRGDFSIVKDSAGGEALKLKDGMWVFEIPAGGVLHVKETYPFQMWHTDSYVFADGTAAQVQDLGVQSGTIITGPDSAKSSTEYDGTVFLWKTVDK